MKVGLIARMDRSGLGQGQTLRLARLLNPNKIMLIDSTPFNGNEQFPKWYKDYKTQTIMGFPSIEDIGIFLSGLDVVISCETFYNNEFTMIAKEKKVKTILIANYEFFDWLKPQYGVLYPPPDKVIMPSYWHLEEMKQRFNAAYLPTPIFDDEFKKAREANLRRSGKRKYLFMNGTSAERDRNGLKSLYEAVHLSKEDFKVVIKSQGLVTGHPDPRFIYDPSDPENQEELYKDFDAMILPRRYAGQCLPMCEALLSGLPVIMTDVDPNNKVLPAEWLIPSTKIDEFMTRAMIDVYAANPNKLAEVLDTLDVSKQAKLKAYEIGKQYDAETLRPWYEELLNEKR